MVTRKVHLCVALRMLVPSNLLSSHTLERKLNAKLVRILISRLCKQQNMMKLNALRILEGTVH